MLARQHHRATQGIAARLPPEVPDGMFRPAAIAKLIGGRWCLLVPGPCFSSESPTRPEVSRFLCVTARPDGAQYGEEA